MEQDIRARIPISCNTLY